MLRNEMLAVILLLFGTLCGPARAKTWSHAEYGAGNYGEASDLREMERKPDQYKVLFDQLDALVKKKGPDGIFYLNDISEKDALYAGKKLEDYCQKKGYSGIHIRYLVGDYDMVALPRVDSAHLRNPPLFFLYGERKSGKKPFEILERLANSSATGLYVTTHKPRELWKLGKGLKMKITNLDAPEYRFPDGSTLTEFYRSGRAPRSTHKRFVHFEFHISPTSSGSSFSHHFNGEPCSRPLEVLGALK